MWHCVIGQTECIMDRRNDKRGTCLACTPVCRTVLLPALTQLRQRTALYPTSTAQPLPPANQYPSAPAPYTQQAAIASYGMAGAGAGAAPGMLSLGPGMEAVPAMFVCPITQDLMDDPVVAADGYTYERDAIQEW